MHTAIYSEDGTDYTFTYAYNNQGTLDTLTYPLSTSGYQFVLKNVYDAWGFLSQVKDNAAGTVFWSLSSANDASLPTLEALGNGTQIATSYTPWTNEMLTRSEGVSPSTTNLQSLTYNWDPAGNLNQRIDNRQTLTEQFSYDSMNRLLTSQLNGANNLTMTYSAAGNIATKSDVSATAYVYDTTHKHAVKTAGSWSMTYDANGNMITRAGGAITWKSYNLPATISYSGNSTQFWYNANHQRWKQVAICSGTTETSHYIGGLLEVMTRGSAPTEYRHQIPTGSSTVVYTRRTDGTTGTYYATSDHLGSSDLVMDSAASVLTRESFTSFGARRGSAWSGVPTGLDYTTFGNTTRKGFTGHEMVDSVALVHMNGRVYDPFLGRFLSPDSVVQSLGATESVNPYAYAWNNSLRYTDPSGHSLMGDLLGALAAALIVVFAPELGLPVLGDAMFGETVMLAGFVGGFVGAYVSTGSLSAAVMAGMIGAVTAAAFYDVGSYAASFQTGSNWTKPFAVLSHAAVGCGSAMLSGGNCGRGALSAGLSEAAVRLGAVSTPRQVLAGWGSAEGIAEAGLVGGAAAEIAGGRFSDGFSVSAAGYIFNAIVHNLKELAVYNQASAFASAILNDKDYTPNQKAAFLLSAIHQNQEILSLLVSGKFNGDFEGEFQASTGDNVVLYEELGKLLNETNGDLAKIARNEFIFGALGGLAGGASELAGAATEIGGHAVTAAELVGSSSGSYNTVVAVSPMGTFNRYYVYMRPNQ